MAVQKPGSQPRRRGLRTTLTFNLNGGQDTITDFQNGIDKIVIGSDIASINLFEFQGSAALELTSGSASTATYVRILGVPVSQIDGSDFIFS